MLRLDCMSSRGYRVRVVEGVFDPTQPALRDTVGGRRCVVVVDPVVDRLHGAAVRAYLRGLEAPSAVMVCDLTEHTKTMETVLRVCAFAQRHSLGRRDLLVAVGGGVCCDVVSVAASLVRRGLPYVCVPTTLLGQVDAGIGLKGGVNFGGGKNYLGSFTPPYEVLLDPGLLGTLHRDELRQGLAEMLKIALVRDGALFDRLRAVGGRLLDTSFREPEGAAVELVAWSARLMLGELARDCYEDGDLRRLADFGHTFGVAVEETSGYAVRHGDAVALDMALSSALALELGLLAPAVLTEVLTTFVRLGLPVSSPWCTRASMQAAMAAAVRHRDGALNLVVPTGIGTATFVPTPDDVPVAALDRALARVAAFAAAPARVAPGPVAVRGAVGSPTR